MIFLASNPFCPYCYGNDRRLEQEIPDLSDSEITIIPMDLTPDYQEFDDKMYATYHKMFDNEANVYLHKINQVNAKYYKKENIGPSKYVFLTYYFLREHGLGLKFYHEVTKRFYEGDFNYSNVDNLVLLVEAYGINKDVYLNAINDSKYLDEYNKYKDMVDEFDIDTVPTYVIDNQVYSGISSAIKQIKTNRN